MWLCARPALRRSAATARARVTARPCGARSPSLRMRIRSPAVFLLQLVADRTGPQWVTVDFYHRGRNVGSLTLEVDVRGFQLLRKRTRRAAIAGNEEAAAPVSFGPASVIRSVDGVTIPQGTPLPAADVELRIIRDADGRTLHFHLHSQKLPTLDGRAVGSVVFNDLSRPDIFFDRLVERLSSIAARAGAELHAEEASRMEDEVADIGIELYEQLFPEPLRKAYWEIKAAARRRNVEESTHRQRRTVDSLGVGQALWT